MKNLGLRQPAPVFADPRLLEPTVLHLIGCPALRDRRCRCGAATTTLPVGPLDILRVEGASARVQHPSFGPTWIELELLKPLGRSVTPPAPLREHPPADWTVLAQALEAGLPRYGRRRRPARHGEIVWVREELRDQDKVACPWRLLFTASLESVPTALLIDPSLPGPKALAVGWNEVRHLALPRGLASDLLPAFPLPDVREDPGWPGRPLHHDDTET